MLVETFQPNWTKDGKPVTVSAAVASGKEEPPEGVVPGMKTVVYDTEKAEDRAVLGPEFLAQLEKPSVDDEIAALKARVVALENK